MPKESITYVEGEVNSGLLAETAMSITKRSPPLWPSFLMSAKIKVKEKSKFAKLLPRVLIFASPSQNI